MGSVLKARPAVKHASAIRRISLPLLLAAAVLAGPAYAQLRLDINIGPPPPQHEIMPPIAPGYIWAPGYWGWSGQHHVWVRGRPIVQREGYRWEPDRWDQRDSSYYRTAGHWKQDRGYRHAKMKKEKKAKGGPDNHGGDE